MRYIGDTHGRWQAYKRLIKEVPASIQVGDLGVGFLRTQGPNVGETYSNPPHALMVKHNARFIRGNHDNPAACRKHSQWIADGTYDPVTETMFIGGAYSIDKAYRIPGYSWWPDEELSYAELKERINVYEMIKPKIMVTHDAPQAVAAEVIRPLLMQGFSKFESTRTRDAFQQMWAMHSPVLWIFGHYHVSFDHVLQGTRFICLPELGVIDL